MFKTKYRISRDWYVPSLHWSVEKKSILWPFWVQYRGLLNSKEQAEDLINTLAKEYR